MFAKIPLLSASVFQLWWEECGVELIDEFSLVFQSCCFWRAAAQLIDQPKFLLVVQNILKHCVGNNNEDKEDNKDNDNTGVLLNWLTSQSFPRFCNNFSDVDTDALLNILCLTRTQRMLPCLFKNIRFLFWALVKFVFPALIVFHSGLRVCFGKSVSDREKCCFVNKRLVLHTSSSKNQSAKRRSLSVSGQKIDWTILTASSVSFRWNFSTRLHNKLVWNREGLMVYTPSNY